MLNNCIWRRYVNGIAANVSNAYDNCSGNVEIQLEFCMHSQRVHAQTVTNFHIRSYFLARMDKEMGHLHR